jgi:hypothetical protein
VDPTSANPPSVREDQVMATRRTLKQMNEAADRAIDDQVARSTPMTLKK